MSVAYASTSFGATQLSPSYPHTESTRQQQRQSSSSSQSSATAAASAQGLPLPATAHSPTRAGYSESIMRYQYDQIGVFFGGGRNNTERTRDNNSGRGRDRASTTTGPPSYDAHSEAESLPTYTKVEEYDAYFNRKLFIYGFLFFPFWILGIVTPFVKPRHNPTRDNRSKEDQEADYANVRKAEMLWAKRCGFALLGFVTLVVVAVVVGVTVSNNN